MMTESKNEHKVFIIAHNKVVASTFQGDDEVPAWYHGSYDDEAVEEMTHYCHSLLRHCEDVKKKDVRLDDLQAVMVVYTCAECGKGYIGDDQCWYRSKENRERREEFLKLIKKAYPITQGFSQIFEPRNYYTWHETGCLSATLCEACYKEFNVSGLDIVGFLEKSNGYLSSLFQLPYYVVAELDSTGEDSFMAFSDEKAAREAFAERIHEITDAKGYNFPAQTPKEVLMKPNYIRVDSSIRMYVRKVGAAVVDADKLYLVVGYDENDRLTHISAYKTEHKAKTGLCGIVKEYAATYGDDKMLTLDDDAILDTLKTSELTVEDSDGKYVVFSTYEAKVKG